eukprot:TRINITY_DN18525_c0_g1_i1.p1 TRINITY_DN18525_c0_g1~~TRINITY_DN18525_c0_g1_i1.p1  ORF type:complete len:294 (+),score=16.44 TRINITY_DN18525_c0_g1_i1:53-934(+)
MLLSGAEGYYNVFSGKPGTVLKQESIDYLKEHAVPQLLDEVIQKLLKTRPDSPRKTIVEQICGSENGPLDLELISLSGSPLCLVPKLLLAHKGVSYKNTTMDSLSPAPDWFLTKVPSGRTPALYVNNGAVVLDDPRTICEYLDEVYTPSLGVVSGSPTTRAIIRNVMCNVQRACDVVQQLNAATTKDNIDQTVKQLDNILQQIETVATGCYYLLGRTLTLADVFLAALLSFASAYNHWYPVLQLDQFPKLKQLADHLLKWRGLVNVCEAAKLDAVVESAIRQGGGYLASLPKY